MSVEDAAHAIRLLEEEPPPFDYDEKKQYVARVKEFVRRSQAYCEAKELPLYSPFIDVRVGAATLPEEMLRRVDPIAKRRQWSPSCTKAVCEHLKFLLGKDCLSETERELANVYEPLFSLILEGGDFYEHHGDVCIRAAATVVLRRNWPCVE